MVAALACVLVGCPTTATTTTYTPITGILIQASTVTAGRGCGTGDDQVYRYAVTLAYSSSPNAPFLSNVFECFADGLFSNLPASDSGSDSFIVTIYAFNQASFPPVINPCEPQNSCPAEAPSQVIEEASEANWTTICSAEQIAGVSSLAVCPALEPPDAGGDATTTPQAEAGAPEGGDAGVTAITVDTHGFGTLRCGSPMGFDTVDGLFHTSIDGGPGGMIPAVPCPAPLVLAPVLPDVEYIIEAHANRAGTTVATSTCTATAVAGMTTQAICAQ